MRKFACAYKIPLLLAAIILTMTSCQNPGEFEEIKAETEALILNEESGPTQQTMLNKENSGPQYFDEHVDERNPIETTSQKTLTRLPFIVSRRWPGTGSYRDRRRCKGC